MWHTPTVLPGYKGSGQRLAETQSIFIPYGDEVLESNGNLEPNHSKATSPNPADDGVGRSYYNNNYNNMASEYSGSKIVASMLTLPPVETN